jgi:hypothetical protein
MKFKKNIYRWKCVCIYKAVHQVRRVEARFLRISWVLSVWSIYLASGAGESIRENWEPKSLHNITIHSEVPSDGQLVFATHLDSAWRIRGLTSKICNGGCQVSIELAIIPDGDENEKRILSVGHRSYEQDDFDGLHASDEGLFLSVSYSDLEPYTEFSLRLSVHIPATSPHATSEPIVSTQSVLFRTGVFVPLSSPWLEDDAAMDRGACRLELHPAHRSAPPRTAPPSSITQSPAARPRSSCSGAARVCVWRRVPLLFVDEDALLEPMPFEMLVRPPRASPPRVPCILGIP